MRIAILGWGSLIWDPRNLPRKGNWEVGGPTLPIEFTRVSADRRLTLVIDPANGVLVATRFVLSPRANLAEVVADLRKREGTSSDRIGYLNLNDGTWRCSLHSPASGIIRAWADANRFDAVAWTDLPSNFRERTGEPFSVEAAERYLRRLPKSAVDRARRYIENAPPEVDTPLRRRLLATGWIRP